MKKNHKNRARHDRRVAARKGIPLHTLQNAPGTLPLYSVGSEVRILSEAYGSRYKGRKATVASVNEDGTHLIVKSPMRKSEFVVAVAHVEAA